MKYYQYMKLTSILVMTVVTAGNMIPYHVLQNAENTVYAGTRAAELITFDNHEIKIEIRLDGTEVITDTETKLDDTKVITVTENFTDNTKRVTVTEKKDDVEIVRSVMETKLDGSSELMELKPDGNKVTTVKRADGSSVETTQYKKDSGEVSQRVIRTQVDGTKVSEMNYVDPVIHTVVTVTTTMDKESKLIDAISDTVIQGSGTSGKIKAILPASVLKKVKQVAGTESVDFTVHVNGSNGVSCYKVLLHSQDVKVGAKLYTYSYDKAASCYHAMDIQETRVNRSGNIKMEFPILAEEMSYEMVNTQRANELDEAMLSLVSVEKKMTVKKGKTINIQLKDGLDMTNVSKVTYTSSNKKIVSVDEKGVAKGEKKGKAVITVKVSLKNQKSKSVSQSVVVK